MTVVKINGSYQIKLESGKLLPHKYKNKEEAEKRIRQMQHFKNKESLVFEVQDFKYDIEEKEGKVTGLRMFGTALKEGISRNKRTYTIEHLKENDGEMFNFLVAHREDYDNPDHNAGEGRYKLNGNSLEFDGKIYNNHNHPDIIEQVQKGLVSVSVQGGYKNIHVKEGKVVFEGLRIPILALVNKHTRGVEAASIESAIAEKLDLEESNEVNEMSEDFKTLLKEREDEISKLKESLHGKEEELKKVSDKEAEEQKNKKKKMAESLVSMNKELNIEELMEKPMSELELMEKYEKALKEITDNGVSEVQDTFKSIEEDGIVIEKGSGFITMSESSRLKFNKEIMESIYR